jgi:hypothetical protein
MPIRTGQTTSYRTDDDGDLEQGRGAAFLTLSANNPFGNTNRFTDELGTQTYANDIIIDWEARDYGASTVLGYYRVDRVALNWDDAIDTAAALSIGTFTTGWYLPNIVELFRIFRFEGNAANIPMDYAPFNLTYTGKFWSSTTRAIATSQAHDVINNSGYGANVTGKTTATHHHIYARIFTVTGTVLT